MEYIDRLIETVPSERQLNWQRLEFTAFFHYGINSFTNREWGEGNENIAIFNPQKMDTDQWCRGLISAGIKACIITAKHHDGFCLWDTSYTKHSVMYTPYAKDIVKQLSQSCIKYNIKFGIYLSPWDRHEASYGSGKAYDDYFCNQLTELMTNYGQLYTVWFDGACGEGPNGKKQQYDWNRYYKLIRKLQPDAVISVSGPDVRWCGNEAGDCRESEWSVVPARLFSQKAIAENSQTSDNTEFRIRKIDEMTKDLGSREALDGEKNLIWYPAEVDTSIRPGWFYHPEEDSKVRSLNELTDIYVKAVGGNSVLLLNIPPHFDGYLADEDMERLKEIGDWIKSSFSINLADKGNISNLDNVSDGMIENIRTDNDDEWQSDDNNAEIMLTFDNPIDMNYIVIKEQISKSQRVEEYNIRVTDSNGKNTDYSGTTIGYKKIIKIKVSSAVKIQIRFTKMRKSVILRFVGVY